MREVGHLHPVEDPTVGVGDRLPEGVLADSDRAETQVELANVHRVERRIEGGRAGVEHVFLGHLVLVQAELGDVVLRVDHVSDQLVFVALRIGREEDVALRTIYFLDPAKDRDDPGLVAVADVVLLAARRPAGAVGVRGEDHVGRVDVGAVLTLGESEGEDRPITQELGRLLAGRLVSGHEERPQPQDRYLPGVPVGKPVEGRDLVEGADPGRVPPASRVPAAVALGGEEGLEDPELGLGIDEVPVPDVVTVGILQRLLAASLEPLDHPLQPLPVFGVEVVESPLVRVEDQAVAGGPRSNHLHRICCCHLGRFHSGIVCRPREDRSPLPQ